MPHKGTSPKKNKDVLKPRKDKCSFQEESCANGQDLAYPLHISETEGNPTNTRATNSDKLLSCSYCVSNYQQIIIACLHHVITTLKLKPGKNRTNTDTHDICVRGTVTLEVLLCPAAQNTCRSTGHFWIPEADQEEPELPFFYSPSSTTSRIVLFWGGSCLSWRGLVTQIQKLCRGSGDQDIFPSQQCGTAHGITMKLQTWLLSRTQPRTSLHSGFNIQESNCSFLLHDTMLNYTSLSLVFRMGYSDSQMI